MVCTTATTQGSRNTSRYSLSLLFKKLGDADVVWISVNLAILLDRSSGAAIISKTLSNVFLIVFFK